MNSKLRYVLLSVTMLTLIVAPSLPASATDFQTQLKNIDGSPMVYSPDREKPRETKPVTLAYVVANALLAGGDKDDGAVKIEKYELATKVYGSTGDVQLTAEEIVTITRAVEKAFGPLIYAQAIALIEPGVSAPEKK